MVAEERVRTGAPGVQLEEEEEGGGALPLCIGPGCPKEALPDSVYCGTDCILQHAAATIKTFSAPKEPPSRAGQQGPPAAAPASAQVGARRDGRCQGRR